MNEGHPNHCSYKDSLLNSCNIAFRQRREGKKKKKTFASETKHFPQCSPPVYGLADLKANHFMLRGEKKQRLRAYLGV
jgi:hypothetical protein